MGFLDKLLFWRKDEPAIDDIDGCFTLPGAELDGDDACAVPPTDEAADSEA